jgi:hypothetical protein
VGWRGWFVAGLAVAQSTPEGRRGGRGYRGELVMAGHPCCGPHLGEGGTWKWRESRSAHGKGKQQTGKGKQETGIGMQRTDKGKQRTDEGKQ